MMVRGLFPTEEAPMYELKTTDEKLRQSLEPVLSLLEQQKVVDSLLRRQQAPQKDLVESLVHRQQLTGLRLKLKKLHAADIAYLLKILPPDERLLVWSQVDADAGGDVLWDLSDPVAEQLIVATDRERLLEMCGRMDVDELGQITQHIPQDILQQLLQSLDSGERKWLQSSITYPEDSVGHLMGGDMMLIPETASVRQVLKILREQGGLPEQTDKLFVVDERQRFKGVLPLTDIFMNELNVKVAKIVRKDAVVFSADDSARAAAQAFERYDLVSAPVVDGKGKLIGRLTVDVVMDFVREQAEDELLRAQGLSNVDLFTPLWNSAKERWLWLCINLLTAFIASRVISVFEGTIEKLVALAALMPIVASIGGNSGNQTVALFIRGLALNKITPGNVRYLAFKEVGVAVLNGLIWGVVIGLITIMFYHNYALGGVMALATFLNLVVAVTVGIAVPLTMQKLGRDPALGSSVLLTFSTDSMGFLIFLGLATMVWA
jgi:magnesium transporter